MIWTPSSLAGRKKTVRVIDVNHNNPVDRGSLTKAGVTSVIYKISQGNFPDPERFNHHQLCQAMSLNEGGYFFTEPGPGAAQAQFFWTEVLRTLNGPWPGPQFVLAIDLEPDEKLGKMTIPQAEDAAQFIVDKTGYWPLLYGGGGLLRDAMEYNDKYLNSKLINCRLWLADPRQNWRIIRPWSDFALRQCAEDHESPGWDYNEIVCPDGFTGDPSDYLNSAWPSLMAKAA